MHESKVSCRLHCIRVIIMSKVSGIGCLLDELIPRSYSQVGPGQLKAEHYRKLNGWLLSSLWLITQIRYQEGGFKASNNVQEAAEAVLPSTVAATGHKIAFCCRRSFRTLQPSSCHLSCRLCCHSSSCLSAMHWDWVVFLVGLAPSWAPGKAFHLRKSMMSWVPLFLQPHSDLKMFW